MNDPRETRARLRSPVLASLLALLMTSVTACSLLSIGDGAKSWLLVPLYDKIASRHVGNRLSSMKIEYTAIGGNRWRGVLFSYDAKHEKAVKKALTNDAIECNHDIAFSDGSEISGRTRDQVFYVDLPIDDFSAIKYEEVRQLGRTLIGNAVLEALIREYGALRVVVVGVYSRRYLARAGDPSEGEITGIQNATEYSLAVDGEKFEGNICIETLDGTSPPTVVGVFPNLVRSKSLSQESEQFKPPW